LQNAAGKTKPNYSSDTDGPERSVMLVVCVKFAI